VHVLQRFHKRVCIARIETNIIDGPFRFQSDRFADHIGDGLGFCFAYALCGFGAARPLMKTKMAYLVRQGGELLGG
jgi:hypothetical protein